VRCEGEHGALVVLLCICEMMWCLLGLWLLLRLRLRAGYGERRRSDSLH
jgi:hypothetical protein